MSPNGISRTHISIRKMTLESPLANAKASTTPIPTIRTYTNFVPRGLAVQSTSGPQPVAFLTRAPCGKAILGPRRYEHLLVFE